MTSSRDDNLRDWVPIRVHADDGVPYVDLCYAGEIRFTDPFYRDTIWRMLRRPFSLLFQRRMSFDELRAVCDAGRSLQPTGFIFHMSRCGSTLISQMLASVPTNIVVSEAPPIDSVLTLHGSEHDRRELFRSIVAAFGRVRGQDETRHFIKFDSWHTLDLDLVLKVFPDVPWIFVYRNPVEVIVSHMRQRGSQMIPGNLDRLLPDLSLAESLQLPAEEYCARVLARFLQFALEHASHPGCQLVNYSQLPNFMFQGFAEHFGCEFTEAEISQMNDATKFNAKTPQMLFEPDTEQKKAEASAFAREAAAQWVDPLYNELERLRLEQQR